MLTVLKTRRNRLVKHTYAHTIPLKHYSNLSTRCTRHPRHHSARGRLLGVQVEVDCGRAPRRCWAHYPWPFDRHRLLRDLTVALDPHAGVDFLHQEQHRILRFPITNMTSQRKQILVEELQWGFLQDVIDPTRLVELAQRQVRLARIQIRSGRGRSRFELELVFQNFVHFAFDRFAVRSVH